MSTKSESATLTQAAVAANPAAAQKAHNRIPYFIILLAIVILIVIGIVIYATSSSISAGWSIIAFYVLSIVLLFIGFIWIIYS